MSAGGGVWGRLGELEHLVRTLKLRVTSEQGGGVPAAPHASSHYDGGSDEADVTQLGGFPGGSPKTYLDSNGEFTNPADAAGSTTTTLGITIDGGGSPITTGIKGDLRIPFDCTITKATVLADQSGSIVIDVWKDTYANYPPTAADSITASAKPTLSSAVKSEDSTLTGWTTSITAGQTLRFNVDSASTVTRVNLQLDVTRV